MQDKEQHIYITNEKNGSIINVGVVKTTSTFCIIFNKINALIFNT